MTEEQADAEVLRLGHLQELFDRMMRNSIQIGSRIGVSVRSGVRNVARGQCLFEAVSSHLRKRRPAEGLPLVFQEIIDDLGEDYIDHQRLREGAVAVLENSEDALEMFNISGRNLDWEEFLTVEERRQEFKKQMNALKKSGEYACDAADLLVVGLSLYLGLNIVLMRTSTPDILPLSLNRPEQLRGDESRSRIRPPILLAYDQNSSHYEDIWPADEASEEKLQEAAEHYMEHNVWPELTGGRENASSPDKKRKKRKLLSMEKEDVLEFSPEESTSKKGRSSCQPHKSPGKADRDRSPSPDTRRGNQTENVLVSGGTDESVTANMSQISEAPVGDSSGQTKKHKYDTEILEGLTVEEALNYEQFRDTLDQALAELPQLKEELKKARMGDEKIIKLVTDYKDDQEGSGFECDLQTKKFGQKANLTVDNWIKQIKAKICPFLHEKYPGLDLGLLLDFGEEVEHDNYQKTNPPRTKSLHKFTSEDIKQSVNSSFLSLINPGPSRWQLLMAWGALCNAIVWYARENRFMFSDRNVAADTIEHYEDASRKVAGGIKVFKNMSASKRADDELKGKSSPELAALASAVKTWYQSEERRNLIQTLKEVSDSGKIPTKSQYIMCEELVHTDMVLSGPHRNIVWQNFPYLGLAEAINSPGWDPNYVDGRDELSVENIVEDGFTFKVTNDVTRPPPSLSCQHQSTDPNCKCPEACPPCGYNILLTWDKGQGPQAKRNRFLHIPNALWEEIVHFCAIRDRYLQHNFRNGPSGKESESWFKGTCPLLLNGAGNKNSAFLMRMASRIMGIRVNAHMFRHLFCTFLANAQNEQIRAAQPQVCGQSASTFQAFYNMNTRSDAQASMLLISEWNSAAAQASRSMSD